MRGYLLFWFSLVGLIIFSFCLLFSSSLSFFWLFLELLTLSLVPSFFLYRGVKVLSSLFSYLVVSGVSSSLLVCGILFEKLLFFSLLGMLIKFGLFPFMGWVYNVLLCSNWFVVWGFSTLSKVPFFFFSFFILGGGSDIVIMLGVVTLVVLFFLFWFYSYSWLHCWCHMMLSSSVVLVVVSESLPMEGLSLLFLVYLVWSSLVVLFLRFYEGVELTGVISCFLFVVLFLSFPVSVSIFYKFVVGVSVFACSFVVFISWVLYSISEQLYLLSCLLVGCVPRFKWSGLGLV